MPCQDPLAFSGLRSAVNSHLRNESGDISWKKIPLEQLTHFYGCVNCGMLPTDHLDDGKCLFETTYFFDRMWSK